MLFPAKPTRREKILITIIVLMVATAGILTNYVQLYLQDPAEEQTKEDPPASPGAHTNLNSAVLRMIDETSKGSVLATGDGHTIFFLDDGRRYHGQLIAKDENGIASYLLPAQTDLSISMLVRTERGRILDYTPYLSANGQPLPLYHPVEDPESKVIKATPLLRKIAEEFTLEKIGKAGNADIWQMIEDGRVLSLLYLDPATPKFGILHSFVAEHLGISEIVAALQEKNAEYETVQFETSPLKGYGLRNKETGQLYSAYALPGSEKYLISGILVDEKLMTHTIRQLSEAGLLKASQAVLKPAAVPETPIKKPIKVTTATDELPFPTDWVDNQAEVAEYVGNIVIKNLTAQSPSARLWHAFNNAVTIRLGNPEQEPVRLVLSTTCLYCAKLMIQLMPLVQSNEVYIEAILAGKQAEYVYAAPNPVTALYELYFSRASKTSFRPSWASTEGARNAAIKAESIIQSNPLEDGSFKTPTILYRDRKTGLLVRSDGIPENLATIIKAPAN